MSPNSNSTSSPSPSNQSTVAGGPTNAGSVTIPNVIALLDGRFATFATQLAENHYALWAGSAISQKKVPDLNELLSKIMEHLRRNCKINDPSCPKWQALHKMLKLAMTDDEMATLTLTDEFQNWQSRKNILEKLNSQYSKVLNIKVGSEDDDYLYWDVIDLRSVYAAEQLEPDCEHFCIAMLCMEGALTKIATPNWDILIEKALKQISAAANTPKILVSNSDAQVPGGRVTIVKFHGCAQKAKDNPTNYRNHIIARQPQIDGWAADQEKAIVRNELIGILTSKKSLFVGLSAQDPNIRAIVGLAAHYSAWPWPSDPSASIFVGGQMNDEQRSLLENIYKGTYLPATRNAIETSSQLIAYSKSFFTGALLHVFFAKLGDFLKTIPVTIIPDGDKIQLEVGLRFLRDRLGTLANSDPSSFIEQYIPRITQLISVFRRGQLISLTNVVYEPLSEEPASLTVQKPGFGDQKLREFSLALALIGLGATRGYWSIHLDDRGGLRLRAQAHDLLMALVINDQAALALQQATGDAPGAIIQAMPFLPLAQRAPRSTRRPQQLARRISIAQLLAANTNLDELMARFRQGVSL